MRNTKILPLRYQTPFLWAEGVLREPLELLSDQAYLEKKAANNALEFLNLWPSALGPKPQAEAQGLGVPIPNGNRPHPPLHWLSSIAAIAHDETSHLKAVLKLLEKRGGVLARSHKNPYALDLRKLVRKGKGGQELVDRLLVSALIEARSCERFERLAESSTDPELSKFYAGLIASENGHYQLFVDMAMKILAHKEVETRWDKLLDEEAKIIQAQPVGPFIHSGTL